jgi:hypothetical protein
MLDADGSVAGLDFEQPLQLEVRHQRSCASCQNLNGAANASDRLLHLVVGASHFDFAVVARLPLTELGLVRIASDFWLPSIAEHFAGSIQVLGLEAEKPLFASDPENSTFSDQPVTDIAPLAACTELKQLVLKSIEPLAMLTDLTSLNISDTECEDISPLASNALHMPTLLANNCPIKDISVVARMSVLKEFHLKMGSNILSSDGLTDFTHLNPQTAPCPVYRTSRPMYRTQQAGDRLTAIRALVTIVAVFMRYKHPIEAVQRVRIRSRLTTSRHIFVVPCTGRQITICSLALRSTFLLGVRVFMCLN